MNEGGKVLIIETLVGQPNEPTWGKMQDFTMLLVFKGGMGIVRLTWRELVDQKWSRHSCGELIPLSEHASAILLEDTSAVEVAVQAKMVVDRGVNGSELLQGLDVPEFCHCALPSSKRLV